MLNCINFLRTLFNLGLKDAKELVEKAPCVLGKAIKKDDVEKIETILKAASCVLNIKWSK